MPKVTNKIYKYIRLENISSDKNKYWYITHTCTYKLHINIYIYAYI